MEGKKIQELRLFGKNILHSDKSGKSKVGEEEEYYNIQESDRKGFEVTTCSDEYEDTKLTLSIGRPLASSNGGEGTHSDKTPGTKCGKSTIGEEEYHDIQESDRKGSTVIVSGDDNEKKRKFQEDIDKLEMSIRLNISAGPSNNYNMHVPIPILRPEPLRFFPPTSHFFSSGCNTSLNLKLSVTDDIEEGTLRNTGKTQDKSSQESKDKGIQNSSPSNMNNDGNERKSMKRKGKRVAVSSDLNESKSMKNRRRSTIASHTTTEPVPTIQQVPKLLTIIESQNGTQPVFLYRKKLQMSDVSKNYNRIFLTKCEQLKEFLTEAERRIVHDASEGLEVYAVDPEGKFYKLHLGKWGSLEMLILKSEWRKLVERNNAETGFWVEMWGYRLNGKFCLAVNFRKATE